MWRLVISEVLFWLRLVLFKYAISIALAYVIIGVCCTMKCERNGNHETNLDVAHVPLVGWLEGYTRWRQATLTHAPDLRFDPVG